MANVDKPKHIKKIELDDCEIPIGCPLGLDPEPDVVPNHHKCQDGPTPCDDTGCSGCCLDMDCF